MRESGTQWVKERLFSSGIRSEVESRIQRILREGGGGTGSS